MCGCQVAVLVLQQSALISNDAILRKIYEIDSENPPFEKIFQADCVNPDILEKYPRDGPIV
jgi:hypothetical protein